MLFFLSVLLTMAALFIVWRYRNNALHPAFWTNIGFCGYAAAGFYYASSGYDGALFLNLSGEDIDRPYWFQIAMAIVLVGFVSVNLGFWAADRRHAAGNRGSAVSNPFPPAILLFGQLCALVLIALGVAYWVYMAQMVAGNLLAQFASVAAYRYMVAEAGLSSLPFHLAYGGIELLLLLSILRSRHRWVGLVLIPLGMLIVLSTGRIAAANVFGFVAIAAYLFATRGNASWRTFGIASGILAPLNVAFYFFRQYSSYVYIGRAERFPLANPELLTGPSPSLAKPPVPGEPAVPPVPDTQNVFESLLGSELIGRISYIVRSLVGGGNVPDLQQIILIVKGVADDRLKLEYGATYLDWFRNLLGSQIGAANTDLQSVGYRVLDAYFPNKVGGPTPGMIGEALLNFGFLAPLALFGLAYAMTLLFGAAARSSSVLTKLLYCKFLIGIWALLLKVDSSLLLGFLWAAAPITLCWLGLKLLTVCARQLRLFDAPIQDRG